MLLILKLGEKLLITFSSLQGKIFFGFPLFCDMSRNRQPFPLFVPICTSGTRHAEHCLHSTVFLQLRHLVTTVVRFWPQKTTELFYHKSTNVPEVHGNIVSYTLKINYGFFFLKAKQNMTYKHVRGKNCKKSSSFSVHQLGKPFVVLWVGISFEQFAIGYVFIVI